MQDVLDHCRLVPVETHDIVHYTLYPRQRFFYHDAVVADRHERYGLTDEADTSVQILKGLFCCALTKLQRKVPNARVKYTTDRPVRLQERRCSAYDLYLDLKLSYLINQTLCCAYTALGEHLWCTNSKMDAPFPLLCLFVLLPHSVIIYDCILSMLQEVINKLLWGSFH